MPLSPDGLPLDPLRPNSDAYLAAEASPSQWQSPWMLPMAGQDGQQLQSLLEFPLAEVSTARLILLGLDPMPSLDAYASKVIREGQQ